MTNESESQLNAQKTNRYSIRIFLANFFPFKFSLFERVFFFVLPTHFKLISKLATRIERRLQSKQSNGHRKITQKTTANQLAQINIFACLKRMFKII